MGPRAEDRQEQIPVKALYFLITAVSIQSRSVMYERSHLNV